MYQCVTMLPVSETSSTSFYIQLEIYDAELDRSVIATKVFDPVANSSIDDGSEDEVQGDGEGLSRVVLVGAVVSLVLLGAGAVLMLRGRWQRCFSALCHQRARTSRANGRYGFAGTAERLK